jgi:hypothetical protein
MKNQFKFLLTLSLFVTVFSSCEKENSYDSIFNCSEKEAENFEDFKKFNFNPNENFNKLFESEKHVTHLIWDKDRVNYSLLIFDKINFSQKKADFDYPSLFIAVGEKLFYRVGRRKLFYLDLNTGISEEVFIKEVDNFNELILMQKLENNLVVLYFNELTRTYQTILLDVVNQNSSVFLSDELLNKVMIDESIRPFFNVYGNEFGQNCILYIFKKDNSSHYIVYSYNLDSNKEEYSIETDQTIYSEEWPEINTINNRKLFLYGLKNNVVIDYKKGEIQNLTWLAFGKDYFITESGELYDTKTNSMIQKVSLPDHQFAVVGYDNEQKMLILHNTAYSELFGVDISNNCIKKFSGEKPEEYVFSHYEKWIFAINQQIDNSGKGWKILKY